MTEALKLVHFKEGYIFECSDYSYMHVIGCCVERSVWIYHNDTFIVKVEDCDISDVGICTKLAIQYNPLQDNKGIKLAKRFFIIEVFDCNEKIYLLPRCQIEFAVIGENRCLMELTTTLVSIEDNGRPKVQEIHRINLTETEVLCNIAEEAYRDIWNSYHNSLEVQ